MENITRTVYGAYIQSCHHLGVAPVYPEWTTLNQKWGINDKLLPNVQEINSLSYWCWGNRGHANVQTAEGIWLPTVVQHRATDAALYGQLPFVLRETNNDLTAAQRAGFALRRMESHGGINYYAYYLRRLDKTNVRPQYYYTAVVDGVEKPDVFTPTSANLTPVQPAISNTGTGVISADYVSAKTRMTILITEDDAREMLNVAKVIYGDERLAIVSEVGLCTGVDRSVTATGFNGANFTMVEALGVQIATHVATNIPLASANTGASFSLDVGSNEPLFAISATDGQTVYTP